MSWASRFRIVQYLKQSLWIYPLIGAILGVLLALLTRAADTSVTVPSGWRYAPSTASTILTTIVGAMVGLTGFVVTVTVLAIQMATGTFSARYMRIWYRDPLLQSALTVLVGTLAFAFALLRQVGSASAPNIGITVAGALVILGLVVFLLFFDRFIHRLRPVAVAALVGKMAQRIFSTVVRTAEADAEIAEKPAGRPVLVVRSQRSGSIQAIGMRHLVGWASRSNSILVFQAAVGDFVTVGEPVMAVFGNSPVPANARKRLLGMVAFGTERTIEQDTGFALRIMADIAVKALSAAINDPTTAVQALDHISHVLRLLGSTVLHGTLTFRDDRGAARLMIPGRTWDDYLALALTEIREYGSSSIQVGRRLNALLRELRENVLPVNQPAVEAEMTRLDRSVAAAFASSVDRDLAAMADRQGLGGEPELRARQRLRTASPAEDELRDDPQGTR